MIFEDNKRELQKSGDFKSQTFGIKNAGKIFKILVDGIYSDPYGSIVREIVSNAVDANTESKTDKNVIVKWIDKNVITGSEETLVIRDFGKGMSQDIMFDVFCNLGESTKELDNTQIGGFGIGAKSPFKYTDSFTVKTIFEGIEYLYNLNLNEEGVAEANLIYSNITDEDSGTEVQIPIKEGDKYKFTNAIQNQLFFFLNIDYVNITVQKAIIEEETENYIEVLNASIEALTLKLGNVLYPINFNVFDDLHYSIKNSTITLKFNIGEIFPIASREAIDYTTKTKEKIIDKIIKARSEYTLKKIEAINNETKLLHYLILVENFNRNSFTLDLDVKTFNGFKTFNEIRKYINVKEITKNSVYSRKNRINNVKIDISEKYNIYNETIKAKFLYKESNSNTSKNWYLYDQFPEKVIIIEKKQYEETIFDKTITQQVFSDKQDWLINHFKTEYNCESYDEFEVPKEDKVIIPKVVKVKEANKINYKNFVYDSNSYQRSNESCYKFNNESDYILNLNSQNVVYAFIDEKDDFIEFISIFSGRTYPDGFGVKFIRIAKSNEHLITGTYYKKLLNQEMTINELQNLLTANYIYNNSEYKHLVGLQHLYQINDDIHKKYLKLGNYVNPHTNNYRYKNNNLLNATIELAIKNNLLDNDYLNLFNELVEYNKDIKLLASLHNPKKELIIDFLELKGKSPQQEKDLNQLKLELNIQ